VADFRVIEEEDLPARRFSRTDIDGIRRPTHGHPGRELGC
jgi:hypothetical protein